MGAMPGDQGIHEMSENTDSSQHEKYRRERAVRFSEHKAQQGTNQPDRQQHKANFSDFLHIVSSFLGIGG
jgi:hypothetical protein